MVSCVLGEIFYGAYLIRLSYVFRFFLAISSLVLAVLFFGFSFLNKSIVSLFLANWMVGAGVCWSQLTVLGYSKFFPSYSFAYFKLGLGIGNLTMALMYFVLKALNKSFFDVNFIFLFQIINYQF